MAVPDTALAAPSLTDRPPPDRAAHGAARGSLPFSCSGGARRFLSPSPSPPPVVHGSRVGGGRDQRRSRDVGTLLQCFSSSNPPRESGCAAKSSSRWTTTVTGTRISKLGWIHHGSAGADPSRRRKSACASAFLLWLERRCGSPLFPVPPPLPYDVLPPPIHPTRAPRSRLLLCNHGDRPALTDGTRSNGGGGRRIISAAARHGGGGARRCRPPSVAAGTTTMIMVVRLMAIPCRP
jgi:hypothetical protein